MKNLLLPLAIVLAMLSGCAHDHSEDGHSHEEAGLEPLAYTVYSQRTELFVEFKPLVVGQESKFAAHFTALGDRFKALTEGVIELSLLVDGQTAPVRATEPSSPGIFRLALTPKKAGTGMLVFNIKTKEYSDTIVIDNIMVYANEKTALDNQPEEMGGGDIVYLKEQAWKVEFANAPVRKQPFHNVVTTSGRILAAPGDEMAVTGSASGIVLFAGNSIIGTAINQGNAMFTISGGNLAEGNIDAKYKEVKAEYDKAKAEYDRAKELVKDKIISEREFLEAKTKFENAQTAFNAIAKNYSSKGQTVSAPMGGYIKNILVNEGQYVAAGTPLATISQNKKLLLQANVSQRYFNMLPGIKSANFKEIGTGKMLDTEDFQGRVVSYGKTADLEAPFIPITFEISNTGNLIPGSLTEVYLKSSPIPDALVVPVSSLMEEQGHFFVYVQTGGESFQKREVSLGGTDGFNVQILSGVAEGERVVTIGAYQIKLSTASGAIPAHGHEH